LIYRNLVQVSLVLWAGLSYHDLSASGSFTPRPCLLTVITILAMVIIEIVELLVSETNRWVALVMHSLAFLPLT